MYGVAKPHKPKLSVSDTDSENLRMSFQSDADMCKKEMTVKVLPFCCYTSTVHCLQGDAPNCL